MTVAHIACARIEGRTARLQGLSPRCNPYTDATLRAAWLAGWNG